MKYVELTARLTMLAAGKPESDYPTLMESIIQDAVNFGQSIAELLLDLPPAVADFTLRSARSMPPEELKRDILQNRASTGELLVDMLPSLKRALEE